MERSKRQEEMKQHIEELQEQYSVRQVFLEKVDEAAKDLYPELQESAHGPFERFLEQVFQLEAANVKTAKLRIEALTSLRSALKQHLEMLEKLKGRLAKKKVMHQQPIQPPIQPPTRPFRRFSIDDLPPN